MRVFNFKSGRSIHIYRSSLPATVEYGWGATLVTRERSYTGRGSTKVEAVRKMRIEYLLRTNPAFAATMERLNRQVITVVDTSEGYDYAVVNDTSGNRRIIRGQNV